MSKYTRNAVQSEEPQSQIHSDTNYFPISPSILNPEILTDFRVYLKQKDRFVLYTRERQRFTRDLQEKLVLNDVQTVYVPYDQQEEYEQYVFDNLGDILSNKDIDMDVRSQVFMDTSTRHVKQIFERNLPALPQETVDELGHIVESSLSFLQNRQALDSLGKFVSHDYKTFSHCIQVFVYTTLLARSYSFPSKALKQVGIGAILHDIGKTRISKRILNKPGKLDVQEWQEVQRHPVYGMGMCARVKLTQRALNCILFHHEKYDGSGYPAGLDGENLPLEIRIITCCDVYDAITSDRPYADAESPFNALKIMSQQMAGSFDLDVFRRFIAILGPGK